MDRLSALVILLAACNDSAAPPPPTSRVEVAQQHEDPAAADKAVATFCDTHAKSDAEGKTFAWPAGSTEPEHANQWRWINVWATWCHPCIDELPLLARWSKDLAGRGHPIALEFLSADDTDAAIPPFRAEHAEIADAARLPDGDPRGAWFQSLGMDPTPPIPVHVLVSPAGKIRCTRAGSIRAKDFAAVERLLSE